MTNEFNKLKVTVIRIGFALFGILNAIGFTVATRNAEISALIAMTFSSSLSNRFYPQSGTANEVGSYGHELYREICNRFAIQCHPIALVRLISQWTGR